MLNDTMKKALLGLLFTAILWIAKGQPPEGYYNSASGKTGTELQQALHDIIDNHTSVSYASLWNYFKSTDKKSNGKVWDMYSDNPGGTPVYEFSFGTDQCSTVGNTAEGQCYNREHSWPKSWFGGEVAPMYTDLFHLIPADGYVNTLRSNYPYGDVGTALITTKNGSKIGYCVDAGYSNLAFEPRDEYKGDMARTYFYMSTRYYKEDSGWPGSAMANGSQLLPWASAMLLTWAQQDPVSQKEIDRNNFVYTIQHNRNPFIDHPEYANSIWGSQVSVSYLPTKITLRVYPNPATASCTVALPEGYNSVNNGFMVYSSTGNPVFPSLKVNGDKAVLDLEKLPAGFYLVRISLNNYKTVYEARIVKN
jgi:endonuclease I